MHKGIGILLINELWDILKFIQVSVPNPLYQEW